MEQLQFLHIVDVTIKWYNRFGLAQFLINLNMYLYYDQAITFLGI